MRRPPGAALRRRRRKESGVLKGVCLAMFAYDVCFQADLDHAQRLLADAAPYRIVRGRRPSPTWFDYKPPPLRFTADAYVLGSAGVSVEPVVEVLLYYFGAMLVTFRAPFATPIEDLPSLGSALYDNVTLLDASRRCVERLLDVLRPAIERARLRDLVEDYTVLVAQQWPDDVPLSEFVERNTLTLARAIEAERGALSDQQAREVLSGRMAYTPTDLAVIDWNSALLFDESPEDVIAVLQHANVELLQLRVLDEELDEILEHADEVLSCFSRRPIWPRFREERTVTRFALVQTDAAVMFEGVNNAIKLLGNQYLARLYRLAADRFDLPSWQASVQRKLGAADSVYQRLSNAAAGRRMEILEVIIIVLIAVSILLMFVPLPGSH
jgi:hypothetical protein